MYTLRVRYHFSITCNLFIYVCSSQFSEHCDVYEARGVSEYCRISGQDEAGWGKSY